MTDDPNLYLLHEEQDGRVFHPIPYAVEGGWYCNLPPGHLYSECGLAEIVQQDGYTGVIFHANTPIGPQFDSINFANQSFQDKW